MAVGGGVRVASSVEAVWGRRGSTSGSRAATTVRCSYVREAGPSAPGGLAEEHYRTLRLRPGATRGEVKKAFRRLALMVRSSSPTHAILPQQQTRTIRTFARRATAATATAASSSRGSTWRTRW
ncbi:unnamed protein product [Urochloa decumbens]|uniref:J domain-containing protein n=1 Tax=Urochloa decumbens TaxID=240449 RepID=A0ABC9EBG0_9POAL